VKISPQHSSNYALNLSSISSTALKELKSLVGQSVTVNIGQVQRGSVELDLNGQKLQAQTNLDLKPNSRLQVQVNEINGQIRLTIQSPNKNETLQQALLRQNLPTQTPLNQTLNFLTQPQVFQLLPVAIQGMLNSLIEQLIRPAQLDGKKLQQAITQSGQFLESQIKNGQTQSLSKDIKAQLFQLQQQLTNAISSQKTPTLTQALTLVNQSIQAIQLSQLQQTTEVHSLFSQLSVNGEKRVESVQLEFKSNPQSEVENWEVMLSMSLKDHQVLEAKLAMDRNEQFQIWFFSDNVEIKQLVENRFELLKQSFKAAGLALNLLQFSVKPLVLSKTGQSLGLIDVKV
jgi:hypothetical protein